MNEGVILDTAGLVVQSENQIFASKYLNFIVHRQFVIKAHFVTQLAGYHVTYSAFILSASQCIHESVRILKSL